MMPSRRKFLQSTGSLVVYFSLAGCGSGRGDTAVTGGGQLRSGNRIRMDANGAASLFLGKGELGQGIGTALAQIAAEELGIDIQRIRLEGVDTDHSPDESYTFSSISIQQSGPPVRQAAAAGRQFLLQQASRSLGVPVSDLTVVDGEIRGGDASVRTSYWQMLAGEQFEVVPDDTGPLMPVSDYQIVGQPVQRLDIPDKVFGDESYLQDLRLPGMVHARVVRPPAERATLSKFNSEAASSLPGVLKIVRDGNFVAVVAAREGQARAAAIALRESIVWSVPSDLPDSKHIHEWLKTADVRVESIVRQESASPRSSRTKIIHAVYQRPYLAHASISPSAALALFDGEKLTVWSHAQGMYPLRSAIAHVLGLMLEEVRCIHMEAAGCFGHNGADDAACDVAAIAMQFPGKPVRLQWERGDEFAWEPNGSAMHIETRAELDAMGRVRSWEFDLWSCAHTSRPRGPETAGNLIYAQHKIDPLDIPPAQSIPQPAGGADRNAIPLYSFQNINVNKHLVTEMPLRVSALRGLGAYGNVFAIESFMDELALAADQDPFEFRLAHLQDARAIALLERLAELSHWADCPEPGSGEGWGMAFARFKNMSSYVGIVYELSVHGDRGTITLKRATAVCDCGLVINPDGVRAQIEGSIIQSSSWTLKEQVRFSESGIESRDWASYPILRFDEVPEVRVFLMPEIDKPALGVGESAQGPTAASIANAIFHASGRRLRSLPLSPETITDSKS